LSKGEQRRSERFRRQRDRQHFIVARGILRDILARYLRQRPREIRFGYGLHGKPYLTRAPGAESLQFNLSHSDGMAVYAISTQYRVGIDIERIRPIPYVGLLREFSPAERSAISLLPEDEQREAFFRLWTCKEAYVKANGQGMSLPFGSFDLGLSPEQLTRMIRIQAPSSESTRWTFIDLPIDNPDRQEWAATVVAEGAGMDLRCWSWCGRASVLS
jgi:4'-phosphopantetheinyl transferase